MSQTSNNVKEGIERVGTVEIGYDVRGAGMPLLLVAGFSMSRAMWSDDLCDLLVDEGFLVVRMDNRDTGKSSRIDERPPSLGSSLVRGLLGLRVASPYTLSDMANDACGLMRALGHERFHVCGASMGGMIAQTIAIEHPECLLSLTSIMSTTGDRLHSLADPRALAAILKPAPTDESKLFDHMMGVMRTLNGTVLPFETDGVRRVLLAQADSRITPIAALRQFTAILAGGSRSRKLKDVRIPTLVLHGTHDPLLPIRGGRAVATLVPGARFVPLEGMGHLFHTTLLPTMTHAMGDLARSVR